MTELVKSEPGSLAVPDFMKDDANMGLKELRGVVKPPYVKIIKPSADSEIKKRFGEGSAVLMPSEVVLISKYEGSFDFVPVFFYVEYCMVNPIQTRGKEPMIRERTFDKSSELAKLCKNAETWKQEHPTEKGLMMTATEILNVVFIPLVEGMSTSPCIMSFSRGEHKTGRRLASLITGRSAPIFGNVFRATMETHKYQGGQYEGPGFGFESADEPFVSDPEQYDLLKQLHLNLKAKHDEGLIESDYDDAAEFDEGTEGPF